MAAETVLKSTYMDDSMDSVLNDDEDERQINPAVTSVLSELHH
jgi:hypothetical protein